MPRILQVDSFTDQPFSGNPAAVCLLDGQADESWMQKVAAEMNLSETAFTFPESDHYRLQWFTPTVEVELCGHATLATAHVLWEVGALPDDQPAVFQSLSGQLQANRIGNRIQLDFPATPPAPAESDPELMKALGVEAAYVAKSKFDFLVQVDSAEMVRTLSPDFAALKSLGVRGVIVTSRSDIEEFDFISRYFAPGAGIDEDPVTGSAHCTLGPFWQQQLNKNSFRAFQASSRGGRVDVDVEGDRVKLIGSAVTVSDGQLRV